MTLAAHAFTQLETWPDLAEAEPSCGTGRGLSSSQGEIAHFHSDSEVDLHLTVRVIRRFEQHLTEATAVRVVPGSPWVTLRLHVAGDVHPLMTLVSLALQAQQARQVPGDVARAHCNDHRSSVVPRENVGGG